eukprot:GHRR01020082.1.p1 GENE.GHRR01020082.1~~GHRR01020082.1.p1  ORF type:complete len:366 (+),score=106.30 GHRR01020082.1:164-1261(+)
MILPGAAQIVAGVAVLMASDDLPDGEQPAISRDWCRFRRSTALQSWRAALLNYRTYVLAIAYAMCFGVELTVHNIVSLYLYSDFGLSLTTAGVLGGVLGLMNICSRFLGGAASDVGARCKGMRGRLWVLQLLLSAEGVFCLLVGMSHSSLTATVGMLFVFSFFCQMACGAVYGIVPFISKRSNGLVAGIVAAGGNLGSVVTQAMFFSSFGFTRYQGFYWMGTTIICMGAFISVLYWPMWGGMCCGPQSGQTEERYYLAEYSSIERAAGLHLPALAFAHQSRSERVSATVNSRTTVPVDTSTYPASWSGSHKSIANEGSRRKNGSQRGSRNGQRSQPHAAGEQQSHAVQLAAPPPAAAMTAATLSV